MKMITVERLQKLRKTIATKLGEVADDEIDDEIFVGHTLDFGYIIGLEDGLYGDPEEEVCQLEKKYLKEKK